MEGYDHARIEKKWQDRWKETGAFKTPDGAPGAENYFFLVEFPYPSGNLHVGHWYAFAVPDIFVRYMRMRGYNVLYPIGFDAFGLPAENAAIKRGLNPRTWTYDNMAHMREQIRSMGASFDWSREVVTCDPAYYKWTQWLFLELFKKGLVYRKETAVNWCPNDKTVLANEQVVHGVCERCGATVEQRLMPQWNVRITEYADRLIDDLDALDWPRQIKEAQRNWIGRSEGAQIDFELSFKKNPADNERRGPDGKPAHIPVFTTRPDTLFGATYIVLAPEHIWVTLATDDAHDVLLNKEEVKAYVEQSRRKTELERTENKGKTGVELKGVKAINPATKEEIPMFIADYVLGTYGTGAIMAVPAHDERDGEFATKFNIPFTHVIEPVLVQSGDSSAFRADEPVEDSNGIIAIVKHWSEDKYLGLKWSQAADWGTLLTGGIDEGMDAEETVLKEIREETGYKNATIVKRLGMIHGKYYHVPKKRNRFGHAPTFVVQLENGDCDEVAPDEASRHELRWLTKEEMRTFLTPFSHQTAFALYTTGIYTGGGFLTNSGDFNGMESEEAKSKITAFVGGRMTKQYRLRDWVVSRQRFWGVPIPMIHCTDCGYVPVPETQLPVVLPDLDDYLPTGEGKSPLAKKRDWVEVSCPSCGASAERETDTLDTFVDSSWYFLRYTDPTNESAFADPEKLEQWMPVRLYSGGSEHTTMHVLYSRFWQKALHDIGLVADPEPYLRRMNRGLIMGPDGQKMSKSRGNVIDPDEVVARLGADTVRMYLAFIGPYNEVGAYPWNPNGTVGVRRFLERVWGLKEKLADIALSPETDTLMHQTIEKVGSDIETLKMNTAVSALMIFANHLSDLEAVPQKAYSVLVSLLSPFAPHTANEIAEIASLETQTLQSWPVLDKSKLAERMVTIGVQINGKTRGTVELAPTATQDDALAVARANPEVAKWLSGGEEVKAVYVPGRIINFVLK